MTRQEYENELKELRERLEKLETAKIEELQSKCWEPNENDMYWTVGGAGDIDNVRWDNDNYDNWHYITGNCFKTEEEAEEYKKQIEYTARYKNYIEEHSEPLDWSDDEQQKWKMSMNWSQNIIETTVNYNGKVQGAIYASSEQILLDAIKEIGEDNFKKYVLGVK
jgi:tRNA U34 5-carboxymethylaminomethyl modifying enzyme MnmG/GidA